MTQSALRPAMAILLAVGLVACSGTTSKRENIEPPAELTSIEASIGVDRLWSRSLGKGEGRQWIRQSPALAEGRVYAADLGGRVFAIDAESGAELWRVDTRLRLSGGPAAGAGYVVVGSLDGDVVAFNADTGEERWRTRVSSEVVAAPLVTQGIAIVRSNDGRVFGLDLGQGSRRWVFDRSLPSLTLRGMGAPVLGPQGLVYFGYADGTVVALRVEDGLRVWEQIVAEPDGRNELERMADIDGEIQVGLDALYAASYKGQMMAIEPGTGRPLWNRDIASYAGLALLPRQIVVADKAGTVWAIDRASSTAAWRQEGLANRWLTSPAVHGGHVVVGDLEGYLHWMRADSGDFAARVRVGRDPIRATPQVSSDGVLVAVTTDGQIAAYRIR